ncbi:MAG: T9SS type A sorting domain-containing protein [Fibrobacter sp.]|nr:T9SS type A sorting domain-containing protein [Fibrobacter sp.]
MPIKTLTHSQGIDLQLGSQFVEGAQVKIIDMRGKVLYNEFISENQNVNTQTWRPGVYRVVFKNAQKTEVLTALNY